MRHVDGHALVTQALGDRRGHHLVVLYDQHAHRSIVPHR
jgi:hypothetical protein